MISVESLSKSSNDSRKFLYQLFSKHYLIDSALPISTTSVMLMYCPTRRYCATEMWPATLAKFLSERVDPRIDRSKMETLSESLANERTEREEPVDLDLGEDEIEDEIECM